MKGTRGGLACKKWENGEFPTQLWLHAATICYCKTETMNQQIWGILWYTLFSNQNQFCFNLSLVFNAGTLRTQLWRSWKNRKKGNSYMAKGGSSLLDFQTQTWPCVDETFWCLFDLRFWGPQKKHGVSCPSCLWRFMFEQCRSICISTCPPCSGLQLATNTINFNARSPSCGTSCESHCYCPSDVAEEFHVHTYPNV